MRSFGGTSSACGPSEAHQLPRGHGSDGRHDFLFPIPGASSALQVADNAGALGWRLSADDVALLDAAADSLPFEFRGCCSQTADSKFVG